MRTRLCYLALILIPLAVFGPLIWQGYGTPEDYLRLASGGTPEAAAGQGILHGALVELAFHAIETVQGFVWGRALALAFVVLTGIALWQLLERGGWVETDALAVALAVVLLPSAQLYAAWGAAWPGALAALLSLAGFAAAESELQPGGTRRGIGLLGGLLLYFAAAMCFLPNAIMAVVPLAGLAVSRSLRQAGELNRWLRWHAALILLGVVAAWLLDRWMMSDAAIADRTSLAQRLIALATFAVPAAGALFLAGESLAWRIAVAVAALAVVALLITFARRQIAAEPRAAAPWAAGLGTGAGLFFLVVVLAPHWQPGYRTVWPLAGIVVVASGALLRGGIGEIARRRKWRHHLPWIAFVLLGILAAAIQPGRQLAEPLRAEWELTRAAVMRANFTETPRVVLIVASGAESAGFPEARLSGRVHRHAGAARAMFATALRERFPAGLPKGQVLQVETATEAPAVPEGGVLVINLATATP